MNDNHLKILEALGQSVWIDYLRKDIIANGELKRMIVEDGLHGINFNSAIYENALAGSNLYDTDIFDLARKNADVIEIYKTLTIHDIRYAADEFRPVYLKSGGKNGYVSLPVNPHLAYNTSGTVEEARRLWNEVNRPNILIRVPATDDGLPAIKQLITEAINIDVSLLFGIPRYRQVADAYISGIGSRIRQGKPVGNIMSVAGFLLSDIDAVIDPIEETYAASVGEQAHFAANIRGEVAISTAKIAYTVYKEIFESHEFDELARQGANPQRLAWTRTGAKNHDYSDIKYIEAVIGKNTINAMPYETLIAYKRHGKPALNLEDHIKKACWVMSELTELGIDIDSITRKLEEDEVEKSIIAFDRLMDTLTLKSVEKTREKV